jgi:hypothetical protein
LEAYFEYMRGDERELDFSQYDRNMLQTLSAQTPLKLLDEIMDYKVREMINMKNDYNVTGNPALEAEWLVALYHADNALKGEKVFLYQHGRPMDWNKFYSTLNGDVNSLRAWVQKM